ncbi:unnamed protein product [Calypogeia fissa]
MVEKTGMTAMIRKWAGLTAGICVQALAGSGLCFSHYSPLLKSVMHLNQVQLNNIGVAKDFGDNVGLLSGFVINLVPPWTVLLIGVSFGIIGYGTLYLVLTQQIAPLPYWLMALLMALATNASTWYNTAVLVTSMRNFPKSRGNVVGIIKGFIGLSGAVFTQIYVSVLFENPPSFVLLLTIAPGTLILLVMYFIRPVTSPTGDYDPEEDGGFFYVYIVSIGLAIYLFVLSFVENYVSVTPVVGRMLVAVMCVFLLSPLAVPSKFLVDKYFRGGRKGFRGSNGHGTRQTLLEQTSEYETIDVEKPEPSQRTASNENLSNTSLREPVRLEKSSSMCLYPSPDVDGEEDSTTMLAVGEGAVRRKRKGPRRGEDFTLTQAFMKADFWLLFFTFFCGVGTGNTALNNLGQIGQALGYADVTVFISLFSICNFLGRLGGGAVSEYYVRLSAMPRSAVMIVAQGLMIIGHLLFAAGIPGSLLVGSLLLGTSYGVHYTIMVPTASELFGLRDFGMIYNFITMGAPFSSLLFSGIIAGYFYDKEAAKESPGKGAACLGSHCYRVTFLIMAGVCLVGLLANVLLTLRIGPVYQSLYGAAIVISRRNSQPYLPSASRKGSPSSPKSIDGGNSSYQSLASSYQEESYNSVSDGSIH